MGLNLGVFCRPCMQNKYKTDVSMIFARHAAFYACIILALKLQYTVKCAPDKTVILITGKPKDPQFGPCWDQDGAGFGISGVYLWTRC